MKKIAVQIGLLTQLLISCSTRPMGHKLDPKRVETEAETNQSENPNRDIPSTPVMLGTEVEGSDSDRSPSREPEVQIPGPSEPVTSETPPTLIAESPRPTPDEESTVDDGGITSGGFFVPGIFDSSAILLQEYWDHEGPHYIVQNLLSETLALELSVWESPARGRSVRVNKLDRPIVVPSEGILDWKASALFPSGCLGTGRCLVTVKVQGGSTIGQIFPPYAMPPDFEGISTVANVNGTNAYESRVQTIQSSRSFTSGSKTELVLRGKEAIGSVQFDEDLPIAIDKLFLNKGEARLSVTLPRVTRPSLIQYSGRICFEGGEGESPCSNSTIFRRVLWITP